MEQVPTMISTKDLAYLEDIFAWNFTASKKTHQDLQNVQLENIKNVFEKAMSMHTKHCLKIVEILGGNYE